MNFYMRFFVVIFCVCLFTSAVPDDSFRNKQLKFTRVREAYDLKRNIVYKNLINNKIDKDSLSLYLRAFKLEKVLEVWAKNKADSSYILVKELPICELSGFVGPKRRYKDLQVPEGFYHISNLNPYSKYYLSMQINYPNASDSIRGVKGSLGNEIFIHGSCISSGCLAITDDRIRELFVYCIEAYNSGQKRIDITIYPTKLSTVNYQGLLKKYSTYKDDVSLWKDLKVSYDLFQQTKQPPLVEFLPNGTHVIK